MICEKTHLINYLITRIKTWLSDQYDNMAIVAFAIIFAIGLSFAWTWNSSNYVTRAQLDAATWRIDQLEKMQSYLMDNYRKARE